MYEAFHQAYTTKEVSKVIFHVKGSPSPRPDGLPACFYHHHWDTLGNNIINYTFDILDNNGSVFHLNQIHICLVSKKSNPLVPSDYRPISLRNVILKMVTKTIANRIKLHMDKIVNNNKSAVIHKRLIIDNIILAYESFHTFHKN